MNKIEKTIQYSEDIKIIYIDFGIDSVHGVLTDTTPGKYLIMINTRISQQEQQKALEHELYHIKENHLYCHGDVSLIEKETHSRDINIQ